jgi:hypothetical protein
LTNSKSANEVAVVEFKSANVQRLVDLGLRPTMRFGPILCYLLVTITDTVKAGTEPPADPLREYTGGGRPPEALAIFDGISLYLRHIPLGFVIAFRYRSVSWSHVFMGKYGCMLGRPSAETGLAVLP